MSIVQLKRGKHLNYINNVLVSFDIPSVNFTAREIMNYLSFDLTLYILYRFNVYSKQLPIYRHLLIFSMQEQKIHTIDYLTRDSSLFGDKQMRGPQIRRPGSQRTNSETLSKAIK